MAIRARHAFFFALLFSLLSITAHGSTTIAVSEFAVNAPSTVIEEVKWLGPAFSELIAAKIQHFDGARLVERNRMRVVPPIGEENYEEQLPFIPAQFLLLGSIEAGKKGLSGEVRLRVRLVEVSSSRILNDSAHGSSVELDELLDKAEKVTVQLADALSLGYTPEKLAYTEVRELDSLRHFASAELMMRAERYRDAIDTYQKALESNGGIYFAAAHSAQGEAYRRLANDAPEQKKDVTSEYLEKFMEDAQYASGALYDLGFAYEANEMWEEAIGTYHDYLSTAFRSESMIIWEVNLQEKFRELLLRPFGKSGRRAEDFHINIHHRHEDSLYFAGYVCDIDKHGNSINKSWVYISVDGLTGRVNYARELPNPYGEEVFKGSSYPGDTLDYNIIGQFENLLFVLVSRRGEKDTRLIALDTSTERIAWSLPIPDKTDVKYFKGMLYLCNTPDEGLSTLTTLNPETGEKFVQVLLEHVSSQFLLWIDLSQGRLHVPGLEDLSPQPLKKREQPVATVHGTSHKTGVIDLRSGEMIHDRYVGYPLGLPGITMKGKTILSNGEDKVKVEGDLWPKNRQHREYIFGYIQPDEQPLLFKKNYTGSIEYDLHLTDNDGIANNKKYTIEYIDHKDFSRKVLFDSELVVLGFRKLSDDYYLFEVRLPDEPGEPIPPKYGAPPPGVKQYKILYEVATDKLIPIYREILNPGFLGGSAKYTYRLVKYNDVGTVFPAGGSEGYTGSLKNFQRVNYLPGQSIPLITQNSVNLRIAECLFKSGKLDEAKAAGETFLKVNPDDFRGMQLLVRIYRSKGDGERATYMALKALSTGGAQTDEEIEECLVPIRERHPSVAGATVPNRRRPISTADVGNSRFILLSRSPTTNTIHIMDSETGAFIERKRKDIPGTLFADRKFTCDSESRNEFRLHWGPDVCVESSQYSFVESGTSSVVVIDASTDEPVATYDILLNNEQVAVAWADRERLLLGIAGGDLERFKHGEEGGTWFRILHFNLKDGALLWEYSSPGFLISNPVFKAGGVYVMAKESPFPPPILSADENSYTLRRMRESINIVLLDANTGERVGLINPGILYAKSTMGYDPVLRFKTMSSSTLTWRISSGLGGFFSHGAPLRLMPNSLAAARIGSSDNCGPQLMDFEGSPMAYKVSWMEYPKKRIKVLRPPREDGPFNHYYPEDILYQKVSDPNGPPKNGDIVFEPLGGTNGAILVKEWNNGEGLKQVFPPYRFKYEEERMRGRTSPHK